MIDWLFGWICYYYDHHPIRGSSRLVEASHIISVCMYLWMQRNVTDKWMNIHWPSQLNRLNDAKLDECEEILQMQTDVLIFLRFFPSPPFPSFFPARSYISYHTCHIIHIIHISHIHILIFQLLESMKGPITYLPTYLLPTYLLLYLPTLPYLTYQSTSNHLYPSIYLYPPLSIHLSIYTHYILLLHQMIQIKCKWVSAASNLSLAQSKFDENLFFTGYEYIYILYLPRT